MAKRGVAHLAVSERLLDHERNGGGEMPDHAAAVGRAFGALFQTLIPIIGEAGTHALFVRSIKLATVELPDLGKIGDFGEPTQSTLNVAANVVRRLCELEPSTCTEVAIGLLAIFLGLLTNFIGEPLVRQILLKAFPRINSFQEKESV